MPPFAAFLPALALCLTVALPAVAQNLASAAPAEVRYATVTTAKAAQRMVVGVGIACGAGRGVDPAAGKRFSD